MNPNPQPRPTNLYYLAMRVRKASKKKGLSQRRREYGEDLADVLERIHKKRLEKMH